MNRDSSPWWEEVTSEQWYSLLAGLVGYMLDAFDVMLYTFCATTIMKEWSVPLTEAGFIMTVTLLSSSLGGLLFGVLADRHGRKLALMLTVIIFSICSGLSGLAQNLLQLSLARALLGLGMGGGWAAGVLLISETWPSPHRSKAIGIMQSGWALGSMAAALVAATVLPLLGWRVVFFLGVAPALFSLWIFTRVKEPKLWTQTTRVHNGGPRAERGLWNIFSPNLLRFTVISTLISAVVMFGYWGLFFWIPPFLATPVANGGPGLSIVQAPLWTVPMMIGAFCGYLSFGFTAERFGRRLTFAVYLLISALLVWVFAKAQDASILMLLGPFVGFFGSGYFSAFGAFISELFPTRVRGSAVGFCYNVGRMLSAFAPILIGALSTRYGLGGALAFLAIAFAAGAFCIFLLPETQGMDLT